MTSWKVEKDNCRFQVNRLTIRGLVTIDHNESAAGPRKKSVALGYKKQGVIGTFHG
jgi:hypothetical protein